MSMPKQIDVYRDWLGVKEANRPLDHYQLLRLKRFEDDPAKIRENYRKMNSHVRKFGSGEYAQQSQDLLNELAKAMLCLTDTSRKGEYDATMGRKAPTEGKRPTLEQLLLTRKAVDAEKLQKARNFANVVGVEIRDALLQQKLARPEDVMPAYAESIGLPYLDLHDITIDESLINKVPAVMARQHSTVPIMTDGKQLLMASPNPLEPNVEEELRLRFNVPVRTVLCTPGDVSEVIIKYYGRDAALEAAAAAPIANQPKAGGAAAAAPTKPVTAEDYAAAAKKRRDLAIVGFNFGGMATIGLLYFYLEKGFLLSAFAAVVVGSITAGVLWMMKK